MYKTAVAVVGSIVFVVGFGVGVGCSIDIEPGSQLAGQECSGDDDCAEGLVCSQRVCRSPAGSGPDATMPDAGDPDTEPPPDSILPPPDTGVRCHLDERRCLTDDTYQICETDPDTGANDWFAYSCEDHEICEDGYCAEMCDDDEQFNPITGECESIDEPCCEGGCDDNEICHDCSCVSFQRESCEYQDQPCAHEGQFDGDFVCVSFDEQGQNQTMEPRCLGICHPGAEDPDATCPGPNSFCSYEEPTDPEGFCLTSCSIDDPCADDAMSCIYFGGSGDDGVCYPSTGGAEVGEPCDADDAFSCADEALCIEGVCRQSCRPFDQSQTDCAEGYCLPFGDRLGMCVEDSSDGQGGCTVEGTTCGEDATGCFPEPSREPGPGPECVEFCRLDDGVGDCSDDGEICEQFDPENSTIGICTPGFTTN